MVVSLECSGFAERCSGLFVMPCCWEKGHATLPAAAAVGPCHCPPLVLVERAGPALEGAETLLLSLFWEFFVFFVLFGKLSQPVLQPTAAGVCERASAMLEPPISIPEHGCTGLTGL